MDIVVKEMIETLSIIKTEYIERMLSCINRWNKLSTLTKQQMCI